MSQKNAQWICGLLSLIICLIMGNCQCSKNTQMKSGVFVGFGKMEIIQRGIYRILLDLNIITKSFCSPHYRPLLFLNTRN